MKIVFTLTLSILSVFSYAQTNNCNNPTTALPVNTTCNTQAFAVNQNNSNQEIDASCATVGTGRSDGWFTVTGTGNPMTITVSGPNRRVALAAFTGCATGEITCDLENSGVTASITFATTISTTYYIQIQRRSGNNNNDLNGNICAVSAAAVPANDDCGGAISLTVNPDELCGTTTSSTVAGATASVEDAAACTGTEDDDVWFSFVATDTDHTVSLLNVAGSTTNMTHSVWEGTCSGLTLVAGTCSDPDAQILTALTIGNTYFVRVYTFTATTGQNSTFDVCIGTPENTTCANMSPVCSDSPFMFTAISGGTDAEVSEPGNNYDCLNDSPNPTWFYMEIQNPGVLAIDITAASDVDFALWGPYANLVAANADCGSLPLPIDCSYSGSATEQANVASVLTGEVYILLVTNFANVAQIITLNSAGSNTSTTNCAILPVTLISFIGENVNSINELSWITASEINNDYFILEKSENGIKFEAFAQIDGAGNSNNPLSYSYKHKNPKSLEYYRLKQVDFDGVYAYSKTIAIRSSYQQGISIYPNPSEENFSFDIEYRVDETYTIVYVNKLGRIINEKIKITKGKNTYQVTKFINLSKGIYFVKILNENGELLNAQKIIKK